MGIEIKYEKKIIAFLDVLGFRRLISSKKTDILSKYYNAVIEQLENLSRFASKKPLEYTIVSDSVVLAFPWNNSTENFSELSIAVAKIQLSLARVGIFMRGGIAIGDFYHNPESSIFVGPGFVNAYELEVSHAVVPRVVVHPSVFTEAKMDRNTFIKNVNKLSCEGIWGGPVLSEYFNVGLPNSPYFNDATFIDYFGSINSFDDNVHEEIYVALKKEIYGSQDHLPKYDWVLRYLLGNLKDGRMIREKLELL